MAFFAASTVFALLPIKIWLLKIITGLL